MSGRTLVTGATGFLGTHLCETLCEKHGTIGATRRASSNIGRLDERPIEWHESDVLDPDAVQSAIEGYDQIYHLAGVGLQNADAETVRRVNRDGTENVLSAAYQAGVERVVFTSTAGTRRAANVADETDLATPIGAYQEGKAAAERVVEHYTEKGLDVVTAHPTSVFGTHDTAFTARLFRLVDDPKTVVHPPGGASIVGVNDLVAGLIGVMKRGRAHEAYILGGENLSYHEALKVIADVIEGYAPPIELPAALIRAAGLPVGIVNQLLGLRMFPFNQEMARLSTLNHFYSSRKAEDELGYEYQPFRHVVEDAWRWYQSAEM